MRRKNVCRVSSLRREIDWLAEKQGFTRSEMFRMLLERGLKPAASGSNLTFHIRKGFPSGSRAVQRYVCGPPLHWDRLSA